MKYRYNYIVPYQDVDATRRLRLYTMENYLLNVAGKVADEMGIGIPMLLPMIPMMPESITAAVPWTIKLSLMPRVRRWNL